MNKEQFLLEGLIIPNEWDEFGKVKTLSLSTNSEQVIPIIMDDVGELLMNHLQALVRAKVDVLHSEEGRKIRVFSFMRINAYSL